MDVAAADRMARALIAEHLDPAPPFAFDTSVKRAGACHYTRDRATRAITLTRITMSRQLVALWPEDEVRDVVLHEIAHALAGHAAAHGPRWQQVARRIGAKPETTYESALPSVDLPWVATCPGCGKVVQMTRAPKGNRSCKQCSGGRYNEAYLLRFARRGKPRTAPGSTFVVELEAAHAAPVEWTRRPSTQPPLF